MTRDLQQVLADMKRLASEYYHLTGRPLGVTGEIAEIEAAEKLGLRLAQVREAGFDAYRETGGPPQRIQIKGRRLQPGLSSGRGRVSSINLNQPFDSVVLVLMDAEYEVTEIWEAGRKAVESYLSIPGSKARNERNSMAVSQFKKIADQIWVRA